MGEERACLDEFPLEMLRRFVVVVRCGDLIARGVADDADRDVLHVNRIRHECILEKLGTDGGPELIHPGELPHRL